MTITTVLGVHCTSLGNVTVVNGDDEREYELLLGIESCRPTAAFARPLEGGLILLPAESVFMQPGCKYVAVQRQTHRLTLNDLVNILLQRRQAPHFKTETPKQAIGRTVIPLFNTGTLDIAHFVHSLQYPSLKTTKALPGLKDALETTRQHWPKWRNSKDATHMLPILMTSLDLGYLH